MSAERGEKEAIMFVPPARAGVVLPSGNVKQIPIALTCTGTSTVATATGESASSGQTGVNCFTFSSDTSFHICFGPTGLGAATTSDMYYPAGMYSVTLRAGIEVFFRQIKATGAADGIFRAYLSSP